MKIDRGKYQKQYSHLCSEYLYHDRDGSLSNYAKEANNLYNYGLYFIRQSLFKNHHFLSYNELTSLIKHKYELKENMLYRKLPYVQSSQQTLKEICNIFFAWTQALKSYKKNPSKFTGRPRIPKYLPKGKRHSFYLTNQNTKIKNGYLTVPKLSNFKLKLDPNITKIRRVVFKPLSKGYFKIIVQYKINKTIEYKEDNGKYVGIDPGLDNLFTVVDSSFKNHPLLINGRQAKSINHFYYKKMAQYQKFLAQNHQLETKIHTKQGPKLVYSQSNRMVDLTMKRNQQIKDLVHKATKRIIDYTLSCGANTIIVGKNKYQKRSINLGKRINQNFYGIPIGSAIETLKYKANLEGITVIETEESYTSQTSFIDNEKPRRENGNWIRKCKGLSPSKRRIYRGLFKSNSGKLINSDVNGAYQIIRKVFSDVKFNKEILGCVSNPVKYNIYG